MMKTGIRVIGAAIVLALAAYPATAQEAKRLSVDAAVDLALKNNLGLQSNRIDTATKKRKVDTAWNVFIPTVDVAGTLTRTNLEQSITGFSFVGLGVVPYTVDLPRWGLSASLSATLNLNIALFEGMRNLRLDYQAGLLSYQTARAKLERDVRKSYYQILLLRENILLMEENIAAAQRRVVQARENFRAGLVPELSVLQAQVASENLRPAIAELRNAQESSLAALAMHLGLPHRTRLELTDQVSLDFVDLDVADLISRAAGGKPEIQELRQSLLLLESGRKLSFYQTFTPTLSLGWNVDPSFQGDPWRDSWFMEDGWKQRSGMFRATIGYRLNGLFPYSKEAQGLEDLDESLRKLNIGLAQAIRGTEVEIYTTVLRLEKSRKTVEALTLNVDLAQRAFRLTEEAYRAGIKDLLEVQNSELELRRAQLEVIRERFNYRTGLLDLEYALGVPFGTLTEG